AVPLMNLLPFAPITRDQYAMLKAGNTAPNDEAKAAFDLPMLCLQDRLPALVRGREYARVEPTVNPGRPGLGAARQAELGGGLRAGA
ncbi:hypothetical protein, partial [Streptococcus pneumoniae]|uniref:hypothetical protein n=1 Tax=Streptococcus pneumoniae TaxID=1313 RepID=UPI001CBF8503